MIYIYKYLFYRIYSCLTHINKRTNTSLLAHNAYAFISVLLAIDIDELMRFIDNRTSWNYRRYHSYIILISIYIINLLLFNKVFNYKDIEREFINEGKTAFYLSSLLSILFVLISFSLIFL